MGTEQTDTQNNSIGSNSAASKAAKRSRGRHKSRTEAAGKVIEDTKTWVWNTEYEKNNSDASKEEVDKLAAPVYTMNTNMK